MDPYVHATSLLQWHCAIVQIETVSNPLVYESEFAGSLQPTEHVLDRWARIQSLLSQIPKRCSLL